MNTPNNKRSLETEECLKNTLISLLKDKELADISVTELCEAADVNRSTFYAHYDDVASLANACAAQIERQVSEQPHIDGDFSWLFEYIKEHHDFFNIYFKLGVSQISNDYKAIFFRHGVYSVIKMWFEDGCLESVEQMNAIIKREYEKIK